MNVLKLLPALVLIVSPEVFAYDGFEADFATCSQGKNKGEVVEACTRLIDNAAVENSVTGMFYGLRASNNDDPVQNCFDARKSLALAEDDALKGLSQTLIDTYC